VGSYCTIFRAVILFGTYRTSSWKESSACSLEKQTDRTWRQFIEMGTAVVGDSVNTSQIGKSMADIFLFP